MGFLIGKYEKINCNDYSVGLKKSEEVKKQNPNSVFTETKTQSSDLDANNIQYTPKTISYVKKDMTQEIIKKIINGSDLPDEKLSPEKEFVQLKETLLANSKITKREDPKLGTCYSCRGHETNMRGAQGAIDLAATTLQDLVKGKKAYLELSKKDPKELTEDEGFEIFAYEQTLKAMQLTIDEKGNLVNTEDCEYI